MPIGIEDHNFRYELDYKNLILNRKSGVDWMRVRTPQHRMMQKSSEEAKTPLISNT